MSFTPLEDIIKLILRGGHNMRKILCNNCYKRLTKKELSVYSLQWQYIGDMYCMKCRDCIDDCREDVCRKGVRI
jgi:hypothetical protein